MVRGYLAIAELTLTIDALEFSTDLLDAVAKETPSRHWTELMGVLMAKERAIAGSFASVAADLIHGVYLPTSMEQLKCRVLTVATEDLVQQRSVAAGFLRIY